MAYEPRTIFDKVSDEGDSGIYVGINYLRIVASQMDFIRLAQREALKVKGTMLFAWLNELRTFRDIIEIQAHLGYSEKEINFFEYQMINNKLEKKNIKIKERDKYEKWFDEIEKMIERNCGIQDVGSPNNYRSPRYINDKKIIIELSNCWRELLVDANKKHLIMPEGQKDMKQLAKKEWIDREATKSF